MPAGMKWDMPIMQASRSTMISKHAKIPLARRFSLLQTGLGDNSAKCNVHGSSGAAVRLYPFPYCGPPAIALTEILRRTTT